MKNWKIFLLGLSVLTVVGCSDGTEEATPENNNMENSTEIVSSEKTETSDDKTSNNSTDTDEESSAESSENAETADKNATDHTIEEETSTSSAVVEKSSDDTVTEEIAPAVSSDETEQEKLTPANDEQAAIEAVLAADSELSRDLSFLVTEIDQAVYQVEARQDTIDGTASSLTATYRYQSDHQVVEKLDLVTGEFEKMN